MRNLVLAIFGIVLFGTFTGCGSDDVNNSSGKEFLEAQKNLPDDGYWLCRLDYTIHYRDGSIERDFFIDAGEGRDAVKQKIAQSCISSIYAVDCQEAVTNQHFLCARAESTGHLDAYKSPTYCQLPFSVSYRNGTINTLLYKSTGEDQRAAVKKIFSTCISPFRRFHTRECSDAIFANATDCRAIQ